MKKQTLSIEVPVVRSKSFGSKPSLDAAVKKSLSANIKDEPDFDAQDSSYNIDIELDADANPWDIAHQQMERMKKDKHEVAFVEPDVAQTLFDFKDRDKTDSISKAGPFSNLQYLKGWPQPLDVPFEKKFVWHLQDAYSQLGSARDWVMANFPDGRIAVGHIDTGIQSEHPAMPMNFKGGRSFISGEAADSAEDKKVKYEFSLQGTVRYFQEQPGHGMATLAILAGGKLTKEQTQNQFEGYFGAIPQADVYSYRICDTVALFGTSTFAKALYKAVDDDQCEVVTMSMGGGPSRRWAKAVNHAYMNGLTLVTAAGNSWTKGSKVMTRLPRRLIYPARWDRVLAATGATAAHLPYQYDMLPGMKAEGGHYMQGNYGPEELMGTAVAAYTPNTTWLTMNDAEKGIYFSYQGGGTSSATPQVAAAAGLWLLANRDKLKEKGWLGNWRQVAAVRAALFATAKKPAEYMDYFGNGIIQAKDALGYFPSDKELEYCIEARASFGGLSETWGLLTKGFISKSFGAYQPNEEMLMLEVGQLVFAEPELGFLLDYNLDNPNALQKIPKAEFDKAREIILASSQASETLKKALG